jgi:hypothetical protein
LNLPREDSLTRDHLGSTQFGRCSRGPRTEVGQRQIEFHQPRIVLAGEGLGQEPSCIEQPPERIARARKMMPHLLRAKTRIDPDEQDSRPRLQDVAKFWHPPNTGIFAILAPP